MKKFKAKGNGWRYKKGDILELIHKEADGCSRYQLKDGTKTYACDDNLEAYQPKFAKGDHVRIIGNSIKNCPHFADIGTIGTVKYCTYAEEYQNEMAFVKCRDFGMQQYIGVQDLELIPKENVSKPKYKVGDTVRITRCCHRHGFNIGETVKIVYVTPRGNYDASNDKYSFYVTDEEIEKVLLDKQGYPLTIGDKVMVCAADITPMQGRVGSIKTISDAGVKIDFETGGELTTDSQNILRLAKNGLPYNVDLYIRTNSVITGRLWSAQHTELIRMRRAACSPTDAYSWETGIYGVLIPRLFDCQIRLGV